MKPDMGTPTQVAELGVQFVVTDQGPPETCEAVPENAQVWYPIGTGIEPAIVEVHIRNIVALKVLVVVLLVNSCTPGPSNAMGIRGLGFVKRRAAYGFPVSRPWVRWQVGVPTVSVMVPPLTSCV
jgi:hypothetical protein